MNYKNKILIRGSFLDMNIFIADNEIIDADRWSIWVHDMSGESGVASTLLKSEEVELLIPTKLKNISKKHHRVEITVNHDNQFRQSSGSIIAHDGHLVRIF